MGAGEDCFSLGGPPRYYRNREVVSEIPYGAQLSPCNIDIMLITRGLYITCDFTTGRQVAVKALAVVCFVETV
jgi:hypothetical protein